MVAEDFERREDLDATTLCIDEVLKSALVSGAIDNEHPAALFYDISAFRRNCKQLVQAFPEGTLHGMKLFS